MMRQIQSFVRREGRMSKAQSQAFEVLWPVHGLERGPHPFDFEQVFGRSAELVLEIGFGDGLSLAEMAAQSPEKNFIGIEVYRTGVSALLTRIEQADLTNLKILCGDAVTILTDQILPNSVSRVQLFFPDPWPKRRHHKRRIVQNKFVSLVASRLKPTGILHMATDWEPYAQWMMEVMTGSSEFTNTQGVGQFSVRPAWRPWTKYERRGHRLGHGTWDLLFSRL